VSGVGQFDSRTVWELTSKSRMEQQRFAARHQVEIKGLQADVYNPDSRIAKGKLHWLSIAT
jgi:hypothetical protein